MKSSGVLAVISVLLTCHVRVIWLTRAKNGNNNEHKRIKHASEQGLIN